MEIKKKGNTIIIGEEDLDIYMADPLKIEILDMFEKNKKNMSLDMSSVTRITTPVIQVILSSQKSFKSFKLKSVSDAVSDDLIKFGVNI